MGRRESKKPIKPDVPGSEPTSAAPDVQTPEARQRASKLPVRPPNLAAERDRLAPLRPKSDAVRDAEEKHQQREKAAREERRKAKSQGEEQQGAKTKSEKRAGEEPEGKRTRPLSAILRDAFVTARFDRCRDVALWAVLADSTGQRVRGTQSRLSKDLELSEQAISKWARGESPMDAANWALFACLKHEVLKGPGRVGLDERVLAGYRGATLELNRLFQSTCQVWDEQVGAIWRQMTKGKLSPQKARELAAPFEKLSNRLRALATDNPTDTKASSKAAPDFQTLNMEFQALVWVVRLVNAQNVNSTGWPTLPTDHLEAMLALFEQRFPKALHKAGITTTSALDRFVRQLAERYMLGFLISFLVISLDWPKEGWAE